MSMSSWAVGRAFISQTPDPLFNNFLLVGLVGMIKGDMEDEREEELKQ